MMELVNGKDDIPYMKWEIQIHVWNHQPGSYWRCLANYDSYKWTMNILVRCFLGVVYSISSVVSSSIYMSMSWYDHQNLIGQNLKIPRCCSKERQPLEFSRKNRPSKTTTKASRKLFECFGCGSIPVISPYLLNRPWWWRQCARNGKVPWPKRLNCPPQLGVTWGWWAWWLG